VKQSIRIVDIPDLAATVAYVVRSQGGTEQHVRIGLHLAGEMIVAGRCNPIEVLRAVQARLADDLPSLMEDLRIREREVRSGAQVYRETGAKPVAGPRSPHAVHRSNTRDPGHRWDLEDNA
jgi:hypothetical protein